MVIQGNMSPQAIVNVWGETAKVFSKYGVPVVSAALDSLVDGSVLPRLLDELNSSVGSTSATCVEGG